MSKCSIKNGATNLTANICPAQWCPQECIGCIVQILQLWNSDFPNLCILRWLTSQYVLLEQKMKTTGMCILQHLYLLFCSSHNSVGGDVLFWNLNLICLVQTFIALIPVSFAVTSLVTTFVGANNASCNVGECCQVSIQIKWVCYGASGCVNKLIYISFIMSHLTWCSLYVFSLWNIWVYRITCNLPGSCNSWAHVSSDEPASQDSWFQS